MWLLKDSHIQNWHRRARVGQKLRKNSNSISYEYATVANAFAVEFELHPNHRTPAKALAPTLKSGRDGRQVARAAIRKTPRAPIPSDTIRTNGFRSDEHVLHARSWAPGRGAGDLYASFCPARNFILRFTFLCLQICSHFEKVSSAAVDTLAEILSR